MIVPPEKVRQTIEKTAGYISRNGSSFVKRLESDSKFGFLAVNDPFHEYYLQCLENEKKAKNGAKNTRIIGNVDNNNQIQFEVDPYIHFFDVPEMSVRDLETIKLVAHVFAVNNGNNKKLEAFKKHLYRKSRSQFEFLKPSHRLYEFFQQLVKSYINCFNEYHEITEQQLMENAYKRAVYDTKTSIETQKQKEIFKKQQQEYASIDWTDFKIVQTVTFDESDKYAQLAVPLNRNELIYRSLEQKTADKFIEEAPPDYEPDQQRENDATARTFKLKSGSRVNAIRKKSANLVASPITGELIPEDQLDLHMKIVLRDPAYETQRENYMKKNAVGSNLSSNEVFANIKRLRGEAGEESIPKKPKVQWDGYKNTIKRVQKEARVSEEEEQRLKKEQYERQNKIGPRFG